MILHQWHWHAHTHMHSYYTISLLATPRRRQAYTLLACLLALHNKIILKGSQWLGACCDFTKSGCFSYRLRNYKDFVLYQNSGLQGTQSLVRWLTSCLLVPEVQHTNRSSAKTRENSHNCCNSFCDEGMCIRDGGVLVLNNTCSLILSLMANGIARAHAFSKCPKTRMRKFVARHPHPLYPPPLV